MLVLPVLLVPDGIEPVLPVPDELEDTDLADLKSLEDIDVDEPLDDEPDIEPDGMEPEAPDGIELLPEVVATLT